GDGTTRARRVALILPVAIPEAAFALALPAIGLAVAPSLAKPGFAAIATPLPASALAIATVGAGRRAFHVAVAARKAIVGHVAGVIALIVEPRRRAVITRGC